MMKIHTKKMLPADAGSFKQKEAELSGEYDWKVLVMLQMHYVVVPIIKIPIPGLGPTCQNGFEVGPIWPQSLEIDFSLSQSENENCLIRWQSLRSSF